MRKIGINTIYTMDVDEIDQFPYLKQIGFEKFAVLAYERITKLRKLVG